MNDLKPSTCASCLPWGFSETNDASRKKQCRKCAGTGLVYAIPSTHRVVSVELLEAAEKLFFAHSQRIVRGDWESPENRAIEIRAIINNKEST